MRMEDVFKSNPAMQAEITPYIGRFQNFIFNSIPMSTAANFSLSNKPYNVELIVVVSRLNNTGTIQVWNQTVNTNIGIPLGPGDTFRVWLDNTSWDVANAMCLILSQALNFKLKNTLARNSLDTSVWMLNSSLGAGGTQTADICFGLGPAQ